MANVDVSFPFAASLSIPVQEELLAQSVLVQVDVAFRNCLVSSASLQEWDRSLVPPSAPSIYTSEDAEDSMWNSFKTGSWQ